VTEKSDLERIIKDISEKEPNGIQILVCGSFELAVLIESVPSLHTLAKRLLEAYSNGFDFS
jgi:hypothetical protein